MKRTSAPIVHAGGKIDNPKIPFEIIGGILTTESSWPPPFGDSFEKHILSLNNSQFINMGCSISDGSFMIEKGKENILVQKSNAEEVLIFFFLNLLMELQNKGTVPVMDILEYAKALESM